MEVVNYIKDISQNTQTRVRHDGKLVDISGKRKGNIGKTELTSFNQTVRIKI
jgi:hypothetical protein